jgi:iron(III) transport system substrate-binding protein
LKALLLALLGTVIFCQPVFARPRSVLDLELVEGAKKEKKLVFYTTMDLPQSIEVVRDFVQKYPFLGLELHPLEGETLVRRIQDEARSGMSTWDVLLGGGGLLQPLLDEKLVASYHSPQREVLSDALNDSEGYWSGYYLNPYVLGYSTTSMKEEEIPKKYDECLIRAGKAIESRLMGPLTDYCGGSRQLGARKKPLRT